MTAVEAIPAALDLGGLSLIDRLKCFNAKERYWVVRQALGHFQPTDAFVQAAAKAAGVPPPSESAHSAVYLAMDYHLNWLHAALSEWTPDSATGPIDNVRLPNGSHFGLSTAYDRRHGRRNVKGTFPPQQLHDADHPDAPDSAPWCRAAIENNQEDVDLLLAYLRPGGVTQLILIEAKCVDGFTEEQLESKAVRLTGIIEARDPALPAVDVKLVLMSPKGLQEPATLERRIQILRTHCVGEGRKADQSGRGKLAELVPAQPAARDGWGWMPLQTTSLDSAGFWVVEFGSGASNESTDKRIEAGKKGERWYWPTWFLRRRKRIVAKDVP